MPSARYRASPEAMTEVEGVAVAEAEVLKALEDPVVVDARDPSEVEGGKGGPPVTGSHGQAWTRGFAS